MMKSKAHLMSIGMFTALAIGIHNFPEGLATFTTAFTDIHLGIVIALAIAIHNIPEGISVSVPIFYATGDRKKAFFYSSLSGLAEPVGGVIGFLLFLPFLTPWFVSFLLALVAGIMVYISLDKILPTASNYGYSHTMIIGLALGMFTMAVSIIMLL
jgi:zinc transporter, ZIP family